MKTFDRKFGKDFIAGLPSGPAVYRVYSEGEALIYVGKAKNLRRRLSQYRNAKRRKKHLKMRSIVKEAERIEYESCASDLDACLLETRLIQTHRPKWNVAGAFHFLYPMLGVSIRSGDVFFCYTTEPESFPDYSFHGAYRSREITRQAFFSLVQLLNYFGHPVSRKSQTGIRHSYVYGFRQIPASWVKDLEKFFRGESREAVEELVMALVENAAARKAKKEIQEHLDHITRFWKHEAVLLKAACEAADYPAYPVRQAERDMIFLKYRNKKGEAAARPASPVKKAKAPGSVSESAS